jgi:hypothetical protein
MKLVVAGLLLGISFSAQAGDSVYVGNWRTTNRRLDGQMTCAVRELEDNKWQGRFYGLWQGVPFDYTVPFEGPPSNLRGTATIDGASYTWTGSINSGVFKGSFGGSRYTGSFELTERPPQVTAKSGEVPKNNEAKRR